MADIGGPRTPHEALVASLHSAVEALTACMESVYDLIEQVDAIAQAEDPHQQRRRTRVSYGGGLSPLASLDHPESPSRTLSLGTPVSITDAAGAGSPGALDRSPAPPARAAPRFAAVRRDADLGADDGEPRSDAAASRTDPSSTAAQGQRDGTRPGAPALMAATDLAHRGYSQEEIIARLRDRWGDEASQILRELMD